MPKLPFYRLRILIPALVCTVTLLIDGYLTFHRLQDTREFIENSTQQALSFKMNEIQSFLSDMMLNNEPERAQQCIANAALDHQVAAILMVDEQHRILFANRREWVATPAESVSGYDPAAADKVRAGQSPLLIAHPGQFVGYYPVALSMQPGELRPRHFGVLYLKYDYSLLLASAEQKTYSDAVKFSSVSVLLSLVLLLVLHFLVTKRIERLLVVMREASKGNLEVRSDLDGHGEINELARAFDEMAAELARKRQELQDQAQELELEITERQMAQDGLEEQAVVLEEQTVALEEKTARLEDEVVLRKKIAESLQVASLFNQQVINGAKEGIIVYDRSFRYRIWNPFMEELSGLSAQEVLGKHPLELFPFMKENGVMENLEKLLAGGVAEDKEYPFSVVQSGKSGWASHASTQLRDLNGEIIGIIATVRDISIHKRTEEQLRQSQKMEAVGQLAGGIAHDFNNILTVIIGCGEMLRFDPTLSTRQLENLNHIMAATERAVQLTRGLLAFSRKQVMAPRVMDLNGIVRQVQTFLTRIVGADLQVKTICEPSDLKAKVDAGQIEQVLINLVTNARDAMPDGGMLCVETHRLEIDASLLGAEGINPGSYALITVSDTGDGMDAETRSRIFEPFFTTKESGKGTGLGMSIVHGIVTQHGGVIKVDSAPGKGTCFKIYLPLIKEEIRAEAETDPALLPRGGTETLLVAEDDAEIRGIFGGILTEYGYDVILAADGEEAVEKFTLNRDRIKLNILDIIMPKKNGVEVSTEIGKLQPAGVMTLYSTGYAKDIIIKKGGLSAGEDIIIKPVRPLDLLRKVREMLDRQ